MDTQKKCFEFGVSAWPTARAGTASPLATHWHGRLDNAQELRAALGTKALAEAELVQAAFVAWGDACWNRMLGDWSVVMTNQKEGWVRLVSDYAGLRPIYFEVCGEGVRWSFVAGELGRKAELSRAWALAFLTGGLAPGATPEADVQMVPPGHVVEIDARGIRSLRFWRPPVDQRTRFHHESDYEERFQELFTKAVAARTRGARRVLAELSGGLDSSSIVCEATRQGCALTTVSYDFPGSRDAPFIREVETHCQTEAVHLDLRGLPFLTAQQTGDAWPGWWQSLYQRVDQEMEHRGASVLLNGQNGDLILGNQWDDAEQGAEAFCQGNWIEAFRGSLAWSKAIGEPLHQVLGRVLRVSAPARFLRAPMAFGFGLGNLGSLTAAARREAVGKLEKEDQGALWRSAPPERRKHFWMQTRLIESRAFLPPEALQRFSCASPFLDRELVEFLLTIRPNLLCRPAEPRRLMRRALRGRLPEVVRRRQSKAGYDAAFQESLRPLALRLAGAQSLHLADAGLVDGGVVREKMRKLSLGLPDAEPELRKILLLELWLGNRGGVPSFREAQATAFDDVPSHAKAA